MAELVPNIGKLLLRIDAETNRTEGGIIIPENVKETSGIKKATVKVAGAVREVDGKPTALSFNVGDRVVVDTLGAVKVKIEGEELLLMRHEDVIAKIQ